MTIIALCDQTSKYHSENDCTYTNIKVPNQSKEINNGNQYHRMLLLRINSDKTIAIMLHHNLSFLFRENFIMHCQYCDKECDPDGSILSNMVSYGDKIFYSHINKSFLRNENE